MEKFVPYCSICYSKILDSEISSESTEEFTCDLCDSFFCQDCSYFFTIHYQFQGSRCYSCADQWIRQKLDPIEKRDNKITYCLDLKGRLWNPD
jgi:hypothetical protein